MPILSGLATGVKSYGFTAGSEEEETDEYFYRTSLLLNGDGTDGAQNNTYLDSSTANSGAGFSITSNGTPVQGTFNPESVGWSLYVNATKTNWPAGCWSGVSGSTFTAEYWFRPFAQGGIYGGTIFGINKSGRTDSVFMYHGSGGQVGITTAGSSVFTSFGTTDPIPLNQWTHVAFTIEGTSGSATGKIYINGVLKKTQLNMNTGIPDLGVGSFTGTRGDSTAYALYGDLASLRIVKDQVLYTGDFTPPSQRLTADSVGTFGDNVAESITGTVLLCTYQDSTIINLGTGGASTSNASPLKQIRPLPLTQSYDPDVHGGSVYFDGTTSNLITTEPVGIITDTTDFSFECWVYCTSTTNYACLIGNDLSPAVFLEMGTARGIWLGGPEVSMGSVIYNRWVHLVFCRKNTRYGGFIDGTRIVTNTNWNPASSTPMQIGINNYVTNSTSGYGITGWMSGVRVFVGSSPYEPFNSSITVPTAPADPTNSTLCLNFTNAGVKDLSGQLNFITVADAQVDTAVKKYGTGSIKFDGNGDYIRLNSSVQGTQFGQGDFTIEFWLYFNTVQYSVLFDQRPSPAATQGLYPTIGYDASNGYLFYFTNSGYRIQSNEALSGSTWYHIALSKENGSTRLFVDGTQVGSTYADTNNYISGGILLGGRADLTQAPFDGHIDDLRITNGVGRYTTNFDPPTKALPKAPVQPE